MSSSSFDELWPTVLKALVSLSGLARLLPITGLARKSQTTENQPDHSRFIHPQSEVLLHCCLYVQLIFNRLNRLLM